MLNEALTSKGYHLLSQFRNSPEADFWHAQSEKHHDPLVVKAVAINEIQRYKPTPEDQVFEGIIAQQLAAQSDHIVEVIDIITDPITNYIYFIMENYYNKGYSPLDEYLQDNSLTFNEIVIVFEQIASVVSQAAKEGVLHQDIKPNNILIRKNKHGVIQTKLGDFGIAQKIETVQMEAMTGQGREIAGTVSFVAFEKFLSDNPNDLDVRTEIFAMGSTIYHLLFNRPYHDLTKENPRTVSRSLEQIAYFLENIMGNLTGNSFMSEDECKNLASQGVDTLELTRFFIKTLGPLGSRYKTPEHFVEGLKKCAPKANVMDNLKRLEKIKMIRRIIGVFKKD